MQAYKKTFIIRDNAGRIVDLISVRDTGRTYVAIYKGKKVSCTAGYEQAARNVFHKVHDHAPHKIEESNPFPVDKTLTRN